MTVRPCARCQASPVGQSPSSEQRQGKQPVSVSQSLEGRIRRCRSDPDTHRVAVNFVVRGRFPRLARLYGCSAQVAARSLRARKAGVRRWTQGARGQHHHHPRTLLVPGSFMKGRGDPDRGVGALLTG